FFLRKAIEIAEKSQWFEQLRPEISRAKELLSTEELAAAFLDRYDSGPDSQSWSEDAAVEMVSLLRATLDRVEEVEGSWSEQLRSWTEPLKQQMSTVLDSFQARERRAGSAGFEPSALATLLELWPQDCFRRLELPETVFGMYHSVGDRTYLLLQRPGRLGSDFDLCGEGVEEFGVCYRITDNAGTYASGLENPQQTAFLQAPLERFFPGWHAAIHFTDVDIFEKTAERQKVVYLWAGLLAIAVMIAAGTLAARVVGRQIKVNKLKNDFIATVSHELKTPLASMRVLVDTLLEGNYRNQQQVTEYLELVSKENERLTGLIDNFLTFSRMERNKQAFAMVRTSPAAIARDAAEAVKTKFSKGRCDFEVNMDEDLSDIRADRDAMVTVLVNLLDNAYKYSYDDKRIELKVYADDGSACFCVSDNGPGMSRRSVRKIFRRFYQADRSLSRRAEGCGLGLSIAKFIVDAHKGSISVDSKPGEGTVFTVRLPVGG
ncbi:MAG: HAMP domain-containing sensor histidine kinase, partial [Planctomycetota bacterium]